MERRAFEVGSVNAEVGRKERRVIKKIKERYAIGVFHLRSAALEGSGAKIKRRRARLLNSACDESFDSELTAEGLRRVEVGPVVVR